MIIDQDGNKIQDGDWIGFCINGLIRGNVAMVAEGGIVVPGSQQPSSAFVNVIVQIPCIPGTSRLPAVSKIAGPHQEVNGG
jgi:hypothetical protein